MKSLLSSLEHKKQVAFQLYTLEHGIERLALKVPLSEAASFELAFGAARNRSKTDVIALVEKFGGKIVDKARG